MFKTITLALLYSTLASGLVMWLADGATPF